jgi:hypothetical protein
MYCIRSVAGARQACLALLCSGSVVAFVACQNGPTGGPVVGAPDNHCFQLPDGGSGPMVFQTTAASSCTPTGVDAGPPTGPTYGPTMFNASGGDDDCKYVVGYSSTPIRQGDNVTFTVTVIRAADGTPVTGAMQGTSFPGIEVFLNNHHPAPNTNPSATEAQPGIYTTGPIRFDAPGQWTVRFHFHEECEDLLPDSPHGHAAYFVNVP